AVMLRLCRAVHQNQRHARTGARGASSSGLSCERGRSECKSSEGGDRSYQGDAASVHGRRFPFRTVVLARGGLARGSFGVSFTRPPRLCGSSGAPVEGEILSRSISETSRSDDPQKGES